MLCGAESALKARIIGIMSIQSQGYVTRDIERSGQSCTGAYAAEKRSKTAIWTIAIWLCIRTIYRYCSVSSKTKGIIHSQLLRDEIGDNAMEIKKLY